MRDIDLISDIELRELQISRMQEEISALKKVAEIYGLNRRSATPKPLPLSEQLDSPKIVAEKKAFGESKFPLSIGDASEQVLKDESDGLHLDAILERIARLGVTPTRTSLDSALRDGKNKGRFELLGKRIWALPKLVK